MALNLNALRAEKARLDNPNQNNVNENLVRMPDGEGTVVVRLLPNKNPDKLPFVVIRTHRLGSKVFVSPMQMIDNRWEGYCPINAHYKSLWQSADKAERAGQKEQAEAFRTEARAIKPLERYFYACVVRYYHSTLTGIVKPTDNKVKILPVGKQLHAKIVRGMLGDAELDEPELGDVTDIVTGRDFKIIKRIRKSGPDSFPNYDESKFMSPSLLSSNEDEVKMWMSQLPDLEEQQRQVKSIEELRRELAIFRGLESDGSTEFPRVNATAVAPTAARKPPVDVDLEGDEALADDDFFKELNKIS